MLMESAADFPPESSPNYMKEFLSRTLSKAPLIIESNIGARQREQRTVSIQVAQNAVADPMIGYATDLLLDRLYHLTEASGRTDIQQQWDLV